MLFADLSANLAAQWDTLPERLGGHIFLSLVALVIGILISIPLGIWAEQRPRAQHIALTLASVIQTIPSLALLALMVFAWGTIGWIPALIALILYSVLPMLRNTITGLEGVDPACIEAARGVGMTERQMLWWVQLPLAAPTILAGIRTASVWVVGLATIAQPVGATSLGNYIFVGLQTSNSVALLFGCIFSAVLALVLDGLLRGMENAARNRSRTAAGSVLVGLLLVTLSPLILNVIQGGPASLTADNSGSFDQEGDSARIVVGGKAFTEQYILTKLLKTKLEEAGLEVELREGLGSTILFEAMDRGEVDCYVDYTGTIWATIMKRQETTGPAEMLIDVAAYLKQEHKIICLGPMGFDNSYAFAMPRHRAEELGVTSLEDLVPLASDLTAGTDVEFFARPEWRQVQKTYGLDFGKKVTMDPTLMYGAVAQGQLDVVAAYTTDGRIAANDLIVLEDPRRALPPYDAILLVRPRVARNAKALKVLRPLVNSISTSKMREANMMVDVEGNSPPDAASWLLQSR